MQDKELYRQLLGLKDPWDVSEIKVDFAGFRVDLWITWPPDRKAPCPECGEPCNIYDHREERQWRHLASLEYFCPVNAPAPVAIKAAATPPHMAALMPFFIFTSLQVRSANTHTRI